MGKKKFSMKLIMSVCFIVLMVATITIIGNIILSNWKAANDNIISKMEEDANKDIQNELEEFIKVPFNTNEVSNKILEKGVVDINSKQEREIFFADMMKANPDEVYSFSVGTEKGEYYGARRNERNEIELMINNAETQGNSQYYSLTEELTSGELALETGPFDPRTRDWYKIAKQEGRPVFSPIYKHFVMNDLAITAAYPLYDEEGGLKGVLGTHIILANINHYLQEIVKDKGAAAYIIENETGELVANSQGKPNFIALPDNTIKRMTIEDIDNPSIAKVYLDHKENVKNHLTVKTDNDVLHMNFTEFNNRGLNWLIITAIPESQLTSGITKSILVALLLSLVAIILSSIIWRKITNKLLEPIYTLITTTEKYANGDLSRRAEILRDDELGKLSMAFNKMADELSILVNSLEGKVEERTKQLEGKNEELKEALDTLRIFAMTDPLTELANRRCIREKIEDEIRRFKRSKTPFFVIIGDIDDFKYINDQYGHECGDYVLKCLSHFMKSKIRERDILSRWGGEEFLLLITDTDFEGAVIVAEKLRSGIEALEITYKEITLSVTITFGVAEYSQEEDIEGTIKRADKALYKGKSQGKNCVVSSMR